MQKKQLLIIGIATVIIVVIIIILSLLKVKEDPVKQEGFTGDPGEEIPIDETLKLFDLTIKGSTNEVNTKIGDTDNFFKSLKEYMYKKGLVQGEEITLQQYSQEGGNLKLRFTMNDPEETRIIAIINSNNEYEFFYYK